MVPTTYWYVLCCFTLIHDIASINSTVTCKAPNHLLEPCSGIMFSTKLSLAPPHHHHMKIILSFASLGMIFWLLHSSHSTTRIVCMYLSPTKPQTLRGWNGIELICYPEQ